MSTTSVRLTHDFAEAVGLHVTRRNESWTMGGLETMALPDGSMLIFSDRQINDDETAHLLAVISRFDEVIAVSPLVDPLLIDALRALIQERTR